VSDRTNTHRALGALIAVGLACVSSCARAGTADGGPDAETPWAQEAVELFDSIAQNLADDSSAAAAPFADRGVLDLRAWGGEVHGGRMLITEALERILSVPPRPVRARSLEYIDLDARVVQLFVGDRQAVVRFDAVYLGGRLPWMQLYEVGEDSVASSRLFTEDLGHIAPRDRWTYPPDHPFYDRYVEVWSSGDPDRLTEVYASSVEVRDALGGESRVGLDALADEMRTAPAIESGPWPERFRFDVGDRHEQIAVFQLGGSCPALEARRWVFDDDLIVDETRYEHVPSVRRCRGPAGDGWWTDFEANDSEEFVVQTVERGRRSIDVVNADDRQTELIHWLFGRYAAGALAQPDVAAVWFPPSVDCELSEGISKSADVRFDQGHTVTLCFDADELSSGWPDRQWSPHVAHQGLHEFAHVWMYDQLDARDQRAFLERVGLASWRDADVFWPERGVEVSAETIAWGLAEPGDAEYLIEPPPGCAELAAGYVMLTGREPLTTCEPAGGD
jgi:hypothetical protein